MFGEFLLTLSFWFFLQNCYSFIFVISELSSSGALQAYEQMTKAGGLQANEDELMNAASKHASLATAQHYLHNPPNVLQRNGLLTQIKTMQHSKGAGWIRQNGIDKNLGSTNQRSNNNHLTIMPSSDDDDDEVEIVENAKIDFTQTNVGKVKRMQSHCRGAINYNTAMKDLSPDEQEVQNELKQAMPFMVRRLARARTHARYR
jgi:hypothetical protein